MKKILTLATCCFIATSIYAQKMPDIPLKTLSGSTVLASELSTGKGPILVTFWATWCSPCIQELDALNDEYIDWEEETGVKIVAIATDDARSQSRVKILSNGKGWEFDIYKDDNQELKRALGITTIPFTCILDAKGTIIWKHTGYTPGSETDIIEFLRTLKK